MSNRYTSIVEGKGKKQKGTLHIKRSHKLKPSASTQAYRYKKQIVDLDYARSNGLL